MITSKLTFLAVCFAVGLSEQTYTIVEGDIQIFEGEGEGVRRSVGTLGASGIDGVNRIVWPGGRVNYVLGDGIQQNDVSIVNALYHYEQETCIRFTHCSDRATCSKPYLVFQAASDASKCNSPVGLSAASQVNEINLGADCHNFVTVVHEIGHTLGLFHEQQRKDRNTYVTIKEENIEDGLQDANFDIKSSEDIGGYDYDSIMHYGKYASSKNGKPTIVTKNGSPIGHQTRLSAGDKAAIAHLYNGVCPPVPTPGTQTLPPGASTDLALRFYGYPVPGGDASVGGSNAFLAAEPFGGSGGGVIVFTKDNRVIDGVYHMNALIYQNDGGGVVSFGIPTPPFQLSAYAKPSQKVNGVNTISCYVQNGYSLNCYLFVNTVQLFPQPIVVATGSLFRTLSPAVLGTTGGHALGLIGCVWNDDDHLYLKWTSYPSSTPIPTIFLREGLHVWNTYRGAYVNGYGAIVVWETYSEGEQFGYAYLYQNGHTRRNSMDWNLPNGPPRVTAPKILPLPWYNGIGTAGMALMAYIDDTGSLSAQRIDVETDGWIYTTIYSSISGGNKRVTFFDFAVSTLGVAFAYNDADNDNQVSVTFWSYDQLRTRNGKQWTQDNVLQSSSSVAVAWIDNDGDEKPDTVAVTGNTVEYIIKSYFVWELNLAVSRSVQTLSTGTPGGATSVIDPAPHGIPTKLSSSTKELPHVYQVCAAGTLADAHITLSGLPPALCSSYVYVPHYPVLQGTVLTVSCPHSDSCDMYFAITVADAPPSFETAMINSGWDEGLGSCAPGFGATKEPMLMFHKRISGEEDLPAIPLESSSVVVFGHHGTLPLPKCPSACQMVRTTSTPTATPPSVVAVGGRSTIDVDGVVLSDIPLILQSSDVVVFPDTLRKDSEITLSCCGADDCNFVVAVWHCPPCSGGLNGGLLSALPAIGFTAASCAPKFDDQPMVSFFKEIAAGDTVTFTAETDISRMAIFRNTDNMPSPWCVRPAGPHQSNGMSGCAKCPIV
eukprot:TRINITY_DN1738_c0_g1_i8.p1 TRINITY_DN1738_c0_g1~~TRINITY_DN1738_c0_g1_i8.p1  ORF type:complete len:1015 (+),score=154.20 TRINITY_DN1738_c0_g1_i8:61-3045(+)